MLPRRVWAAGGGGSGVVDGAAAAGTSGVDADASVRPAAAVTARRCRITLGLWKFPTAKRG